MLRSPRTEPEDPACDCPTCQRLRAGLVVLRRAEDADPPACCYHPLPPWLVQPCYARPTSRAMAVACSSLVVLGWGAMIAAALYARESRDPVRVQFQHILPSFLLTLGLLVTVGYVPARTSREKQLEQELGKGDCGGGGLLGSGLDDEADEHRRDWIRYVTLFFAVILFATGAFLDVMFAFLNWLAPPLNATPQPASGTPGMLLLLQVLAFFLAAAARHFTIHFAQQEREEALAEEHRRREEGGGLGFSV